jgi:protein regulator of cytokinesis 1
VGESDAERDKLLLQLEQECLDVYRRKVDQANHGRTRLIQAIADSESELTALIASLGDRDTLARVRQSQNETRMTSHLCILTDSFGLLY